MSDKPQTAFEVLHQRPYDLLVGLTPSGDDQPVRKIHIYYNEFGSTSNFVFDLTDRQFGNERQKLVQSAVRALLQEVRSRSVANQDFTIWYYNQGARALCEAAAGESAKLDPALVRAMEHMLLRARIVGTE